MVWSVVVAVCSPNSRESDYVFYMVFLYDVGIDMDVVPFHYVWCEHVGYLLITRKTLWLCMHRMEVY